MLALRGHGAALAHSRGASAEPGVLPAAPTGQQQDWLFAGIFPPYPSKQSQTRNPHFLF